MLDPEDSFSWNTFNKKTYSLLLCKEHIVSFHAIRSEFIFIVCGPQITALFVTIMSEVSFNTYNIRSMNHAFLCGLDGAEIS